jgi:carbon storage regulator CsrA
MLILGRRANQSIVFPNCGITVRILDVNGRVTKIGIEAPRNIEIMRGELATVAAGQNGIDRNSISTSVNYEPSPAPETSNEMLQFGQRLAELKSSLHVFQQLRAAGNEARADEVLEELLNDLGRLDCDWLKSQLDGEVSGRRNASEMVSESKTAYEYYAPKSQRPQYVLVIQSDGQPTACNSDLAMHGVQTCTVNNRNAAIQVLESKERFDFIVCQNQTSSQPDLELLQTIRSQPHLDGTMIFVTTNSGNAVEQLAMANQYGIDGWIQQPLCSSNLLNHIVESKQFEV